MIKGILKRQEIGRKLCRRFVSSCLCGINTAQQTPHKDWWLLAHHQMPQTAGCGQLSHSTLSQGCGLYSSYSGWETTPEPSSPTKPQPPQHSWDHIMCLCRTPPLWTQGQSRRVPLVVLLRECLPCHNLTSSNYLGGTEGKKNKSQIVSPFLPIVPTFYLNPGWIPPSPCPQLAPPGSVLLTLAPPPQGQAKLLQ